MTVQLKWPILGVVIPCVLIATLAYGSHYFVLRHHLSVKEQWVYEFYATMIWVSYAFAIFTNPGKPPAKYKPLPQDWTRFCKKCDNYKPPRTHHCRTCNQCVLEMDHHCPWTLNCVGHGNLPHFMRFLFWVIWGTGYLFIQLCKRIVHYYEESNMPSYLFDKWELTAVIFLTPVDFFVFASIFVLFIRCLINTGRGMTQIEIWEWERIETQWFSERLWLMIRANYEKLHNKKFPKLTSWRRGDDYEMVDRSEGSAIPENFTIDDLVFPYDLGIWKNLTNALGYPYAWLIPFAGPSTNGYTPEVSIEFKEEDQLNLPWPPDGVRQQEITVRRENDDELRNIKNYQELRKRLDPRVNDKRSSFVNDLGERLVDFGVDESDEE
ncbi:Palmitoyltransferase PFA4 [Candida viswanathii]|uniref:Palmitoyltransferase PFA4 n=1 Tax=Candida viswanathii TaxID=5486 RepID=A0A367YKP5_9ASCO|nr:Palmitoyltransferase PFA4 [Candida viswanathii]